MNIRTALVISGFAVSVLGCEYVWEDEAPNRTRSGADQGLIARKVEPAKPQTPPDVRPTLAPGEEVSGQQKLPEGVKKVDVVSLVESGDVTLACNMPGLGDFGNVVDEFENTLSKSDGTNPYIVSFSFKSPRKIRGVKVLSTYSDYKWAFAVKGGKRYVTDAVIDGQWSSIAFKEPVECGVCQVEVLRTVRDNFVHLNEIELYE